MIKEGTEIKELKEFREFSENLQLTKLPFFFTFPKFLKLPNLLKQKNEYNDKAALCVPKRSCISRADFRLAKFEKPQHTWRM